MPTQAISAEFEPGHYVKLKGTQTLRSNSSNFLPGYSENVIGFTTNDMIVKIGEKIREFASGNVAYEVTFKRGEETVTGYVLRNRKRKGLMVAATESEVSEANLPRADGDLKTYKPVEGEDPNLRDDAEIEAGGYAPKDKSLKLVGRNPSEDRPYVLANIDGYNIRSKTADGKFRFSGGGNIVDAAVGNRRIFKITEVAEHAGGFAIGVGENRYIYDNSSRDTDIYYCKKEDCSDLAGELVSTIDDFNNLTCHDCAEATQRRLERASYGNVSLPPGINARCKQFVRDDGKPGAWGEAMLAAMEKVNSSCFFDPQANLDDLCPKFSTFDKPKKEHFWLWTFAAVANDESSCSTSAINKNAPNGWADGLFQLEYSNTVRRRAGRSRTYCKAGVPHNTQELTFQFECTASTVNDTICKSRRKLNWRSGYWEKLRNDRAVAKQVKEFPGCF